MAVESRFTESSPAAVWQMGADLRAIDKWDFAPELCLICRYVTLPCGRTSHRVEKLTTYSGATYLYFV